MNEEPEWPVRPAPEIIMALNGVYWRRFPGGGLDEPEGQWFSMVPVSDDNDPTVGPFAIYRMVAWEDHDGTVHPIRSSEYRVIGPWEAT